MCFDKKSFHMPVRKGEQKGLKGFKFRAFIGRFKWHHGSKGVKAGKTNKRENKIPKGGVVGQF